MRALVTGGAGYVGAHVTLAMVDAGFRVSVIDRKPQLSQLSTRSIEYLEIDLLDFDQLSSALRDADFECVVHCAALTSLPLSLADPIGFFNNNVCGTLNLLRALQSSKVNRLIFSSTAAVYAASASGYVEEDSRLGPTTPYGESKLQCEGILKWFAETTNTHVAVLRYFNVAGADHALRAGPNSAQCGAIVPALVTAFALGKTFTINGNSYGTPDGTAIRDLVHVTDLARVHLLLANRGFPAAERYTIYNVGYGAGYSVAEVVNAAQSALNGSVATSMGPPRSGDLAKVIAVPTKLFSAIGPISNGGRLADMLESTYRWALLHAGHLPEYSFACGAGQEDRS